MTTMSFKQVGSTRLYQPPPPDSAYLAFLLWGTASPPTSIPVVDTWPANGKQAVRVGWYLGIQSDAPLDADFEKAVIKALPKPSTTSFAWVRWAGKNADPEVVLAVPVVAGAGGEPVLDADVTVPLPPGLGTIALLKGSPVLTQ